LNFNEGERTNEFFSESFAERRHAGDHFVDHSGCGTSAAGD
jgi:hypothetical protein